MLEVASRRLNTWQQMNLEGTDVKADLKDQQLLQRKHYLSQREMEVQLLKVLVKYVKQDQKMKVCHSDKNIDV
jgi:hypothetical protein